MKLFIFSMIIAGSLAAAPAHAQVRIDAHIGTPAPVIYERDYPGYTYYEYPAWNGHYRDRFYYAHYHRRFEREHRVYFNHRRFDHERFERERVARRGDNHGRDSRGRHDHRN